jgi:hypothetical protein
VYVVAGMHLQKDMEKLVWEAYNTWSSLQEVDGALNETVLITQGIKYLYLQVIFTVSLNCLNVIIYFDITNLDENLQAKRCSSIPLILNWRW